MKKDKEDPFVCGHVVCKTCVDAIVRPQGRCCVCEAKLEEGEKGLIPLGKEGALRCVALRDRLGGQRSLLRVCEGGDGPRVEWSLMAPGTGYAAAGGAEVKKSTIAFRV